MGLFDSDTSSAPSAPDPAKTYQQEIDIMLKNLPALLQAEQDARTTYDPQRIAQDQALQAQFGTTQYQQQLDALHQLDPQGTAIRDQLGTSVSSTLSNPEGQDVYNLLHSKALTGLEGAPDPNKLFNDYSLPESYSNELENSIRGAQAARGNVLGAAPITAETAYKGKAAIDLNHQRLMDATALQQNSFGNATTFENTASPTRKSQDVAGQYLGLATPEQQIQTIQPVTADRTSAYVDPSAGFQGQQLGLANAAWQQPATGNPWAQALGGAAQGYASTGSWWGAALGAAGGYASSQQQPAYNPYSDRRLKTDIKQVGVSKMGHNIYTFRYCGQQSMHRGVMADEVRFITPEAVGERDGFATVDYQLLDVPFETLE